MNGCKKKVTKYEKKKELQQKLRTKRKEKNWKGKPEINIEN